MSLVFNATYTADFINRYFQCTLIREDYLSIPERPGNKENFFREIPGSSLRGQTNVKSISLKSWRVDTSRPRSALRRGF